MLETLWTNTRWYVKQLSQQFLAHDCLTSAGALTYQTLFAVVPFMTVTYAVLSLRPEFEEVGARIQEFVFRNFLPESSAVVTDQLVEFSERAQGLTGLGFAFLFATAIMMLVTLERTLNSIWNVSEPRRGLQRFLLYWGVLSLGPPLIVTASIASIYLLSLPLITDFDVFGISAFVLAYLPILFSVATFTVVYYAVPNCHVPFVHAFYGGVLAAVLFECIKGGFTWMVGKLSFEPIYGSFAAVPLFLIWLYLVWMLILSGAIFVRTLSLQRRREDSDREPPLVKAVRILRLLYDAHQEGRAVSDQEIFECVLLDRLEHERVFTALHEFRLLSQTEDDRWLLGRSLKALTLWELYQRLPEGLEDGRLSRITDLAPITEPLRNMARFGSNEMSVSLDTVFGGLP
ncbi:MAG: YihY family inner membrane protein [Pseudomonadales bacterium]|nr:YihY family inner membrane protein [Pseudomonadales bacterium]MDP6470979.1 YihY family inner membrane protein [Pseudomonadales bacterium]MDP6825836.1 YihY family inner membrane protein [Pseudomonadales bacterium]